ncbi:hypothetical protein E5D57_003315 [Metarhizium anisopliae]|nr:hypothetical protein E5D57_003315 [Metarhizium anisopliae]
MSSAERKETNSSRNYLPWLVEGKQLLLIVGQLELFQYLLRKHYRIDEQFVDEKLQGPDDYLPLWNSKNAIHNEYNEKQMPSL